MVDSSLLHALNEFLFRHDAVEDPLLFYVTISEALFAATLAVVFLLARGPALAAWRRQGVRVADSGADAAASKAKRYAVSASRRPR